MNEENEVKQLSDDVKDFILDLLSKSEMCNKKTSEYSNLDISVDGLSVPLRIDDKQLFFIGCALLPNIVNYLVNVLPQLIYPYIVAYLQDFSRESDEPMTVTQLYDVVKSLLFPTQVD